MNKLIALFFGLALCATPAFAGDSQPNPNRKEPADANKGKAKPDAKPEEKPKAEGKVKAGEACKADTECDQSAGPSMRCIKSKCQSAPPVHPVT